jgi:hypothetical protein
LKEGIKCSKTIDEIEKDLKGWIKLLPKTQGGQGKFIPSKNTKPQGEWLNCIETQEMELGGDGY